MSAFLERIPELASLSHTTLRALSFAFVETAHAPGSQLAAVAAGGPSMHIVLEGEVAVEGPQARRLGPGSIFGLARIDGAGPLYRAAGMVKTASLSERSLAFLTHTPGEIAAAMRRAVASGTRIETGRFAALPAGDPTDDAPPRPGLATAAALGSMFTTILASMACVGPLIAAALGIGGMGVLAQTSQFRWPATIATFLLLALGFVFAYRRPACSRAAVDSRTGLWIATTFALSITLFELVTMPQLG
jgi:hypothetical protein